jgi:putative ABC transport system permease protein
MPRPPPFASALLALFVRRRDRRYLLSDLEEEYHAILTSLGARAANRWYWSQATRSILPSVLSRLGRARRPRMRVQRKGTLMESLWQDVRFAVKGFSRTPGFTTVALLTLTLGIGVNAAAFSLLNSVLLRPVPFEDADRLVEIEAEGEPMGTSVTTAPQPEMLQAWLDHAKSFEAIGLFDERQFTYSGGDEPETVAGATISPNLMDVLRVRPRLGRTFVMADLDDHGGQVVLLSEGFWQRRFGSDPGILGRSLTLDGTPRVVVGIVTKELARLFEARFFLGPAKQVWLPLAPSSIQTWEDSPFVVARLKPDVTVNEAQAELDVLQAGLTAAGLNEDNWKPLVSSPKGMVNSHLASILWVLLASVAMVLLIGCANIANMLMARGMTREHEFAVRSALGANRARLVRQLLTEGLLLSGAGAALGIALTYWCLEGVVGLAATDIKELRSVRVDPVVLLLALGLSIFTGAIFATAPAAELGLSGISDVLKTGNRSANASSRRNVIRQGLVVAEVAMALVLFLGAGLLLNSFLRLSRVDPGFDPSRVVALELSLPEARYPETVNRSEFFASVSSRISKVPQIESVALARGLPPSVPWLFGTVEINGRDDVTDTSPLKAGNWISAGYLSTLGATLREGRSFTELDSNSDAAPVIVNEALAEKFFPQGGAVGTRIRLDLPFQSDGMAEHTIVGVTRTVKAFGLGDEDDRMQVYFPFGTYGQREGMVVVRTAGNPSDVIPLLKEQVWAVDRELPITNILLLDREISDNIARPRFNAQLLSAFALLALFLAIIGVYGVTSLAARQRTREIGVRVALGATSSDILRLMVGSGAKPIAIGVVIGLGASYWLARLLRSLLFGIEPTDLMTYAVATPVLVFVGVVACYLPSRKATRVDPVEVLRQE